MKNKYNLGDEVYVVCKENKDSACFDDYYVGKVVACWINGERVFYNLSVKNPIVKIADNLEETNIFKSKEKVLEKLDSIMSAHIAELLNRQSELFKKKEGDDGCR